MKSSTLAILSGAFAFAGTVSATTLFTEDFESGTAKWDPAASWGTYTTAQNFSGSNHAQIPGGGGLYGNLIGSAGFPFTLPVNLTGLTAPEMDALANGTATWNLDAWLSSWTGDGDYTILSIEWFDAPDGGGESLALETLVDGSIDLGVTESIDGDLPPGPATAWTKVNWSHYILSGNVPLGAMSFQIIYGGDGDNGNDAYVELLQLDLLPPPDTLKWTGALSSEWSNNVLGEPKNWVVEGTATTIDFVDGSNLVRFDDSATATAIDLSNGDVLPVATQFDHSAKEFTLTGPNAIGGNGPLIKDGTATLTLNNANTFTGDTQLNAGTIVLGHDLALQASRIAIAPGATLDFGTLTTPTIGGLSGASDLTLDNATPAPIALNIGGGGDHSGILSGTGSLIKSGPGTQALAGASIFAAGTDLQGGLIRMEHASALGTGPITHNGGALQFSFGDGSDTTVPNDIVLPATGQQTFMVKGDSGENLTLPTSVELTGLISGGTAGEVYRLLDSGDTGNNNHTVRFTNPANSFEGTIQMWRGNLAFTSDEALGNLDNDIQHYTENANGALTFDAADLTLNPLREIIFPGDPNNRPINTQGFNGTIAGPLSGAANMIKQGSGTLTLLGDTFFTGTVVVDEGTLALDGNADLALVTTITVSAGAILDISGHNDFVLDSDLRGDGAVRGPFTSFGAIAPGAGEDTIGTLTTDDLILGFFLDAELDTNLLAADRLVVLGDLNISDDAELIPTDIGGALRADGTKFAIVEYVGTWNGGLFTYIDANDDFVTLNDGDALTVGVNDYVINYDDLSDGTKTGKFITLTVGTPSSGGGFDDWAMEEGLNGSPGKEAGFEDDPEGDTVDNGLEWILGGDPLAQDAAAILPVPQSDPVNGLTLTFTREEDSIGETTLLVQWQTDLDSTWNDVTIGATSSGPDGNGVTVTINEAADPDEVTVNIPATNAANGKIFARLNASQP